MAKRRLSEGVGDWISSLRFSGLTVLIVALVLVGGAIISPTLTTYVQQQRELSELRESVRQQNEQVTKADQERSKWLDPAYVRSQARGRLFYVMPGETQLSIINDVVIPAESDEKSSQKLTSSDNKWADAIARSVLTAGTTQAAPEELNGETK